ncbi:MAG: glycosyl hydrolase, partial [Nevskia sp.]|nr:glycosyl hydrolase [Nevskia sp.]
LEVSVPEGSWRVFAFTTGPISECTHADFLNIEYPNLLDGSAVRRFIDVTHETYYREAGDWFGTTLTGVFTDEPSLMAPIQPSFRDGQTYPNLPWVSDLPEEFQARAGYPLVDALPALVADVGGAAIQRRCDFWGTIGQLLSTRCHRQIGDWCESHGIAYTGHLLWEERIRHHVCLHGDMLECLRYFGWPGCDALESITRDDDPSGFALRTLGAKYVTSAAHIYGKPHTMCETFGITAPKPPAVFEHVLDGNRSPL